MNDKTPQCPYCDNRARLVSGKVIYPHRSDLFGKHFYQCKPCDAYVGCHAGTVKPLGRLANAELRYWKKRAHSAFDPIWQERLAIKSKKDPTYKKGMARGGRYKKLAELMGIDRKECHIGMFDIERCKLAIAIIRSGALTTKMDI